VNWDVASTVAEIVAAVGVIFSLLYLARQIRGSSNTENSRAFESAINSFHRATANLLDTGNLDLFMKGLADYESLSESETLKFHVLAVHFIDRFEIMLQFERLNITDKGHLTGMFGPIMRDWLNYRGSEQFGTENRLILVSICGSGITKTLREKSCRQLGTWARFSPTIPLLPPTSPEFALAAFGR